MSVRSSCACLLCRVEAQLLAELNSSSGIPPSWLMNPSNRLLRFPSVPVLLEELKSSGADARSDELLRELLAIHAADPRPLERLLILAFLPVLHRTARKVAKHQPALSPDDIAQQALRTILEVVHSAQLQSRMSHFAFAISRAIKRQMFAWAQREGSIDGRRVEVNGDCLEATAEDSFERYAVLRHFLHRCVTKGLLTDTELDLLIRFKLEGNHGDLGIADADVNCSNAVRQRLKRLLAKLRCLARQRRGGRPKSVTALSTDGG